MRFNEGSYERRAKELKQATVERFEEQGLRGDLCFHMLDKVTNEYVSLIEEWVVYGLDLGLTPEELSIVVQLFLLRTKELTDYIKEEQSNNATIH